MCALTIPSNIDATTKSWDTNPSCHPIPDVDVLYQERLTEISKASIQAPSLMPDQILAKVSQEIKDGLASDIADAIVEFMLKEKSDFADPREILPKRFSNKEEFINFNPYDTIHKAVADVISNRKTVLNHSISNDDKLSHIDVLGRAVEKELATKVRDVKVTKIFNITVKWQKGDWGFFFETPTREVKEKSGYKIVLSYNYNVDAAQMKAAYAAQVKLWNEQIEKDIAEGLATGLARFIIDFMNVNLAHIHKSYKSRLPQYDFCYSYGESSCFESTPHLIRDSILSKWVEREKSEKIGGRRRGNINTNYELADQHYKRVANAVTEIIKKYYEDNLKSKFLTIEVSLSTDNTLRLKTCPKVQAQNQVSKG